MSLPQQQVNGAGADCRVVIAASGPVGDGGLIHLVTVVQPVQTWTVARLYHDFRSVADRLAPILPGLPACPPRRHVQTGNVPELVAARNELQQWLMQVLLFPGAKESPPLGEFLTLGFNQVPPQYTNVPWTVFAENGQVVMPAAVAPPVAEGNLDDMVMDEMFYDEETAHAQNNGEDSDDEDEYRASERYKPTDEPITEEDEMEIAQMAGEVEMIDDVGSLAQSLGASHLGRSLQLQAELMGVNNHAASNAPHQGLQLGHAVSGAGTGGLGNAMANATHGLGGSFNQTKPESPPRLDAFKMIRVIGKGSFGKVFLVREIKTNQMFALKVLKKDHIIKRNQVEHTKTERSVLGSLSHPFVVGMKMAFQSPTKLYFVLDYCAGGELFFHLGKLGKFPEPRARFYAAEIILAISYVHSLDVIYRDLKPENVLLDAAGHIRLTDFGLSKEGVNSSSSGANSFCGTPEYLAPEILNRQGHGRGVDWWSLGALLYEMLSGLPPFYCQDRDKLFEKIRRSELKYPASLSADAESLLRGLLTKDPTRRLGSGPTDAEEIKRHPFFASVDWEKLQRGEIASPWQPQLTGVYDTSQFDREFTNMPMMTPQSMRGAPGFGITPRGDNHFEGFTFQESILHGPGAQAGS